MEFFDRLFEQFLDVRQDQHPSIPLLHCVAANRGHYRRFSGVVMDGEVTVEVQVVTVQQESKVPPPAARFDFEESTAPGRKVRL